MSRILTTKSGWRDSPTLLSRLAYLGFLGWIFWAITYLFPGAEVVALVALGAMAADSVFRGRLPVLGGDIGRWLFVLLGAFLLTTVTSIWLGRSAAQVQDLTKWILIFLLAGYCLTSLRRLRVIVGLTVLLHAVFPAFGSLRAYASGAIKNLGRADWSGFYGNPNALSAGLVLFMPLAVSLMRDSDSTRGRLLWGGCFLVMMAAVLRSGSRSGFLGLIVVLLWAVWSSRRRLRAMVVSGLALLLFLVSAPSDLQTRLATIGYRVSGQPVPTSAETADEAVGSSRSRLEIWRTGLQIFLENPIVGTGPGTFEESHSRYQEQELKGWSGGRAWRDAHNSFIRVAAEAGLVGLIPLLALFVVTYRTGWRQLRWLERWRNGARSDLAHMLQGSLAGLGAFLVTNLFNTFLFHWPLYMVLAFIAVLVRMVEETRTRAEWGRGGATRSPIPRRLVGHGHRSARG